MVVGLGEAFDGSLLAILEEIRAAASLEGAAVIDLSRDMAEPLQYSVGTAGPATITAGRLLMNHAAGHPARSVCQDGRRLLACPWSRPGVPAGGLLLWRAPHAPNWTEADHPLAASVVMLLGRMIVAESGQIGIDRITGLPNRRWFLDEADRRADRLDHDHQVATLLLIDIDNLRGINTSFGRGQGDRVLLRLATQLRAMVRPSDLVARVGPDEFAVWQDGMDHLTAAERADVLCTGRSLQSAPDDPLVTLSVGIATRPAGGTEDVHSLLRRALIAAREVKQRGGGSWRVSQAASLPGRSSGNG